MVKSESYKFQDTNLWEKAVEYLSGLSDYEDFDFNSLAPFTLTFELIEKVELLDFSGHKDSFRIAEELILFKNLKTLRLDTFMECLVCRRNTDIFNHFELLETLAISDEFLYEGVFDNCKNLKNLFISNKQSGSKVLDILNYSDGLLKNCKNLKRLKIKGFNLEEVNEELLKYNKELTHLDLSYNEISYVADNFLKSCKKLEYLSLNNSGINEIQLGFFDNCVSLKYLDLSNNYLENIPADLLIKNKKLKIINLSSNTMNELPDGLLKNCSELIEFNINNSDLDTIPINFLKNCKKLISFHSKDSFYLELPENIFKNNVKLRKVDLSKGYKQVKKSLYENFLDVKTINLDKGINIIEKKDISNYRKLCLVDNLEPIPKDLFQNCEHIEEIDISDYSCELHEINFDYLKNLKKIYIKYSGNVREDLFDKCEMLEEAYLVNDRFTSDFEIKAHIPKDLFKNCKNLKTVHLKKNDYILNAIDIYESCENIGVVCW